MCVVRSSPPQLVLGWDSGEITFSRLAVHGTACHITQHSTPDEPPSTTLRASTSGVAAMSVVVGRDGTGAAVACADSHGGVAVGWLDAAPNEWFRHVGGVPVTALQLNPDGTRLACGLQDGSIQVRWADVGWWVEL